jgi:HEAT repeat protein
MTRIALWLAHHQLNSKTPARRLWALRRMRSALNDAVVALDDKITIALLDHSLTDAEVEVRREAAGILAELRDSRALPPLIHALRDHDEDVQETAMRGLKKLNDRAAVPELIFKLAHGSENLRWQAAQTLESIGWAPVKEPEQIQFFAALGEAKKLSAFGPAAVPALLELLRSGANAKRISAANVLGEIADPAALRPLQSLLRDDDSLVRTAAIYALERAGFRQAAPSLVPLLKDSTRNVRLAAALALGGLGDAASVEPLIKLLNDKDWELRRAALESLGKIGDTRAFPSVARHLDDTDKEVREVAADAVGQVGNESIVEKLVFTMVDAHNSVRQAAQRALNKIFPSWEKSDRVKRLLPEIQAAMKHRDAGIQAAAANLFQRVAGTEVQPGAGSGTPRTSPAVQLLRTLLLETDSGLRRAAAEAVGRMTLKECADDLKPLLADTEKSVQRAAQAALEKISAAGAGAGRVMLLAKTDAAAVADEPMDDVLLCTTTGEVLHEWNCRDLALWRRLLESILPSAELLARHMKLGETRRAFFQLPAARLTLAITLDGCALFREKNISAATVEINPVGALEKEAVANWLRRLPSARGVLLRGVRFSDATILCDVDSRDLPVAAIEEAYRAAAEIFQSLAAASLPCARMSWRGARTELHCAIRPGPAVLGVLASARSGETDLVVLNRQLAEFQSLTAT